MLLIKAKGGLGNRLLSAASAIAYAEATDRDWRLDWSDGLYAPNGENAAGLLFPGMSEKVFSFVALKHQGVNPSLWSGRIASPIREIISSDYPADHSNPLIYRKLSAPLGLKNSSGDTEIFWSYTSKYGRFKRFLSKSQRAQGRDGVLAQVLNKYFQPKQLVLDNADRLLDQDCAHTLGVHIRYTDLKVPIERLIKRVEAQMAKFHYRSIYLATDSLIAEKLFKSRFSNVITQDKRYATDNVQLHKVSNHLQSLTDADSALVDLFALSKCEGLVYCSRSTFAEISRLIGAFDESRLVDVDRFNIRIRLKRFFQEYL